MTSFNLIVAIMVRIEIVKQPDGIGVLRCTRADGTVTWQKQTKHAAHFALHDLTHYAVETVLGYRRAFFGLIAEGWDVDDTTGHGPRGALPPEALEAEKIVGLFDAERASGASWNPEEFNASLARPLTNADLEKIRELRTTLFHQWSAIAPGEKLKLKFELSARHYNE